MQINSNMIKTIGGETLIPFCGGRYVHNCYGETKNKGEGFGKFVLVAKPYFVNIKTQANESSFFTIFIPVDGLRSCSKVGFATTFSPSIFISSLLSLLTIKSREK
jgi:hypothetical protein